MLELPNMFRQLILLLSLMFILPELPAQEKKKSWLRRFVERSLADTSAPGQRSLRAYPTLAYAPETSFEIGLASLLLYQPRGDTGNRLSEINAFSFVTLNGQYGIWVDNALYTHQDKWFFLGRTRWQRFPLLYYGVGPASSGKDAAVVDGNYLLLRHRILKKIRPNLFAGFEFDYQKLYRSRFENRETEPLPFPEGANGSDNLGLGAALVYDNRHNALNVRKGLFAELAYLRYNDKFLSDYDFHSVNLDLRSFHDMENQQVLAWQVYGQFLSGTVPFNQMSLLGGDMMMRGYYQGRYRDKNQISAQVEYRFLPLPFSRRIGAVVFGGMGTVAPTVEDFRAKYTRFTAGAGLRYLLFRKRDIFIRLDVGFTREGPGFYLYTGEAF